MALGVAHVLRVAHVVHGTRVAHYYGCRDIVHGIRTSIRGSTWY